MPFFQAPDAICACGHRADAHRWAGTIMGAYRGKCQKPPTHIGKGTPREHCNRFESMTVTQAFKGMFTPGTDR